MNWTDPLVPTVLDNIESPLCGQVNTFDSQSIQ